VTSESGVPSSSKLRWVTRRWFISGHTIEHMFVLARGLE